MVYKKYTVKNGKQYGPYLYENKRVGEKVITTYLGRTKQTKKNNYFLFLILGISLLAILSFLIYYFGSPTARAVLEIKEKYKAGENIGGNLAFNLKAGELIPADSKIVVNYGDVTKEFLISELVSEEKKDGGFYVEGKEISGIGKGYGVVGKKEIFPEVNFELLVFDSEKVGEISGTGGGGGAAIENKTEEIPSSETGETAGETVSEVPATETTSEATTEATLSETTPSEPSTGGEVSAPEGTITGGAVHENEYKISGKASKEKDFEYSIGENKDAEIVEGSVNANDKKINDNNVNLKIENNKAIVSTNYAETEEGFGKEFLGEKALTLQINLEKIGLVAAQTAKLNIKLIYNDATLTETEKEISVETNATEKIAAINETIAKITVTNETIVNATLPNVTIINETVFNISTIENVSVHTLQFRAVLGQPVKWSKNISANGPALLDIELPKSAENISITKIAKEEINTEENVVNEINSESSASEKIAIINETLNETNEGVTQNNLENNSGSKTAVRSSANEQTETAKKNEIKEKKEEKKIKIGINGEVISGKVSTEIELKKESKLISWLKKLFKITGKVIAEENTTRTLTVELNETQNVVQVEYQTPAPYAIEENISKGKLVTIVGPEDVHYENVLAFSDIRKTPQEKIKIYHVASEVIVVNETNLTMKNKVLVENVSYEDSDADGLIERVYWVVPSLSNQSYEIIIEISKAEHLNSSREFISDIYDSVKALDGIWSEAINDNEYVRVTFQKNLTSQNDITVYARASCEENSSVLVNGENVPCEVYKKKLRIDEVRRQLNG